jgi:periplasmic protein TonB
VKLTKLGLLLERFDTLQITLAFSAVLHAVVLSVRFIDPDSLKRAFQNDTLEVILVNAKGRAHEEKAQAIAQAALLGGGDAEHGRATSPLLPTPHTQLGDAAQDSADRLEAMKTQQTQLLMQLREKIGTHLLTPLDASAPPQQDQTEDNKRRQLLRVLGEIERRINEESARPRRRYIGPTTREAVYAVYYDNLRQRIEERGTSSFPEQSGRKLYGDLTMLMTINHEGLILSTQVVSGSGNPVLDRRAQAIAISAGPFGAFTPAMRREAEQLVVVARFHFTRDETLQTQFSAQ